MPRQSAFTLIEVLIVLTIISILSCITIPGLQVVLRRAQDNAVRSDIMRMIETAYNEAVLQRKAVTLCKSSDLQHCGGEWSAGQIIFLDVRHDDTVHDESQIITVNQMKVSRGTIHAQFYPRYREAVHFNPAVSTANDNGTFWYCRTGAARPSWALKMNKVGSVHEIFPDSNGEIHDSHGNTLPC